MHPLKKYFTEGLIQVAIFLSLAGMHVDLDSYLQHLHDIHDQSLPLAQTHSSSFQNFPNGYSTQTKSSDIGDCGLTPRVLQLLHSLEYLHIPVAQFEAWLVHSQSGNSKITIPNVPETQDGNDSIQDSASLAIRLQGGGTEEMRNSIVMDESLNTTALLLRSQENSESITEGTDDNTHWQQELNQIAHQEWIPQEHHRHFRLFNEEDEDELDSWQHANPFHNQTDTLPRGDVQYTDLGEDNTLFTDEYLQLLETNFPVEHEQQLAAPDAGNFIEDTLQCHASLLSPLLPQQEPLIELEQQWQDVLAIMGPQHMNADGSADIHCVTESIREAGTMENTTEDNTFLHQTSQSRGSQMSFVNHTIREDNSYILNKNQSAFHFSNFDSNDSDIRDFLSSSALDISVYNQHSLPSSPLEELNLQDLFHPLLDEAMFDNNLLDLALVEQLSHSQNEEYSQPDSDSGLSLDFSQSPASPSGSESSSCSASYCSSSISSVESFPEEGAVGYSYIKDEPTEEEGAVGYCSEQNKMCNTNYLETEQCHHLPSLDPTGHDHTYNQPFYTSQSKLLNQHLEKPMKSNSQYRFSSRDEERACAMKIPFPTDCIINMPVEKFNELLAKYHLTEAQIALIRDIRRRGKNKVAAQNCRRRKLDILLDLRRSVNGLRRHRARLFREKSEILLSVKEMKQRLKDLYQQVWRQHREMQEVLCSASDTIVQLGNEQCVSHGRRKSSKKHNDKQ